MSTTCCLAVAGHWQQCSRRIGSLRPPSVGWKGTVPPLPIVVPLSTHPLMPSVCCLIFAQRNREVSICNCGICRLCIVITNISSMMGASMKVCRNDPILQYGCKPYFGKTLSKIHIWPSTRNVPLFANDVRSRLPQKAKCTRAPQLQSRWILLGDHLFKVPEHFRPEEGGPSV